MEFTSQKNVIFLQFKGSQTQKGGVPVETAPLLGLGRRDLYDYGDDYRLQASVSISVGKESQGG